MWPQFTEQANTRRMKSCMKPQQTITVSHNCSESQIETAFSTCHNINTRIRICPRLWSNMYIMDTEI